MALINCPECKRNGVSDTAKSCPGCGYNIMSHINKKKWEQEKIANECTCVSCGKTYDKRDGFLCSSCTLQQNIEQRKWKESSNLCHYCGTPLTSIGCRGDYIKLECPKCKCRYERRDYESPDEDDYWR